MKRGSSPPVQCARRLRTTSAATDASFTGVGRRLSVLDDRVVQPVLDHLTHPLARVAGPGQGVVDGELADPVVAVLDDLEPAVEDRQRATQVVGDHAREVAQLPQPGPLRR